MKTQAQISFYDEITVDGFCGGGGWSTGFEFATGAPVTNDGHFNNCQKAKACTKLVPPSYPIMKGVMLEPYNRSANL